MAEATEGEVMAVEGVLAQALAEVLLVEVAAGLVWALAVVLARAVREAEKAEPREVSKTLADRGSAI